MEKETKINFKNELDRLDIIVDTISNKSLPFEECLSLYEEGLSIVKKIEEALKESEKKLESIIEIK